jgi:hypothetical protein
MLKATPKFRPLDQMGLVLKSENPKTWERVEEALAIQEEEAKEAGKLGYIGRVHTQATIPHSRMDPISEYERVNGHFHLYVKAPKNIGLPYGTLPRLLLIWMSTEVVLSCEPRLELGKNMSRFFEKLDLPITGGKRGYIRPMREQMIRLFNSDIRYRYGGEDREKSKLLSVEDYDVWWLKPEQERQDDLFPSYIVLTRPFFEDLFNHAIPIDIRAIAYLRKSPLALDLYTWLTHRFSYMKRQTEVPWEALALQFGGNYDRVRDFKSKVKKALVDIKVVYPNANFDPEGKYGLILRPSPTHIRKSIQLLGAGGDSIDLPSAETAQKWTTRHTYAWSRFLAELGRIREATAGSRQGGESADEFAQRMVEIAAARSEVPVGIALVMCGVTLNRSRASS